jgi:hypothetical protein
LQARDESEMLWGEAKPAKEIGGERAPRTGITRACVGQTAGCGGGGHAVCFAIGVIEK